MTTLYVTVCHCVSRYVTVCHCMSLCLILSQGQVDIGFRLRAKILRQGWWISFWHSRKCGLEVLDSETLAFRTGCANNKSTTTKQTIVSSLLVVILMYIYIYIYTYTTNHIIHEQIKQATFELATDMCTYMYIYIYTVCVYIYIYIYISRVPEPHS